MKARYMTDFEKQRLIMLNKPLPNRKPGLFKIPDEYLPLEKRSVRKGQPGREEREKRDRIRALRI